MGLKKELKREPKWDTLPGPLQGRVWGGFWMDLGSILGGFWRHLAAPGTPNGRENRYMPKEIRVPPPGSPKGGFGEGSGRVWGGLGEGSGTVLEGFSGDFSIN